MNGEVGGETSSPGDKDLGQGVNKRTSYSRQNSSQSVGDKNFIKRFSSRDMIAQNNTMDAQHMNGVQTGVGDTRSVATASTISTIDLHSRAQTLNTKEMVTLNHQNRQLKGDFTHDMKNSKKNHTANLSQSNCDRAGMSIGTAALVQLRAAAKNGDFLLAWTIFRYDKSVLA